MITLLI